MVFPFQLIAEIKKVFASATVTGEEFPRLMAILNMTYLPKSTAGQVGALKQFTVDREAGLAQGIRGTCFEHPLLVYNLGGLRPLGKHDQCYSGTAWCAVRRLIKAS